MSTYRVPLTLIVTINENAPPTITIDAGQMLDDESGELILSENSEPIEITKHETH